ncbi:MAG: DUF615 domain-containing protein [Gammaproteobacteria bacterium]|nr:DUF615 domain-containing protein [Gammaproteobacteria bacterium]
MTSEAYDKITSKSQRKRDALALQDLGKELAQLPVSVLRQLPLTNELMTAIEEFHRLPPSHGAKRRQLQYIGRMMRSYNYADIKNTLVSLRNKQQSSHQKEPAQEGWKDNPKNQASTWLHRIDREGTNAIDLFVTEFKGADRQKLRHLHRNCVKFPENRKVPQQRKLDAYLKQVIAESDAAGKQNVNEH